jgi:hypothetical protein
MRTFFEEGTTYGDKHITELRVVIEVGFKTSEEYQHLILKCYYS